MTYHPRTDEQRAHLTCDPAYSGPPGECLSRFEHYGNQSKGEMRKAARNWGWTFNRQINADLCPNHRLPRRNNAGARGFG